MGSTTSYIVSAVAAVIAGLFLAAGGILQQRAASRRPNRERLSVRLLVALVTDRTWLLGIGSAVLSYVFQAVALALGPLSVVQPLIVTELLFAVPISVRIRGLRLRPRDWLFILSVVAGLSIGIVAADPHRGHPLQPISTWAPALVAAVVVATGSVVAARTASGPAKASFFGLAGAIVMGFQSAFFAATIQLLRQDVAHTFTTWEPYALVFASGLGLFLIQNAFQSGPLAASTPVIDGTLPLIAIVLGVWLFGEHVRSSAVGYGGGGLGVALLVTGIIGLDTSAVVRREQHVEQENRDEREAESRAGATS